MAWRRILGVLPAMIACALLAAACTSSPDEPRATPDVRDHDALLAAAIEDLDAARDRWAAAGIDSYRYTINHGPCLCPGPLHGEIVVVAGRVESVTLLDQRGDTEWSRQQLDETVDDLFGRIEAGLGFDRFGAPGEIRVTYDSRTGVPLHVSIDPDVSTIDEEFSWVLTFEAGAVPDDAVPGPEAAASLSEVSP